MSYTPSDNTATSLLARSLFMLALLLFVAACITWVGLLRWPPSPAPSYRTLQTFTTGGFFGVVLAAFAFMAYALYRGPAKLHSLAAGVVHILQRRWLLLIVGVLLLEANLLAALLLPNVAPGLTGPLRFLLACVTVLLLIVALIVHYAALERWLVQTRMAWMLTGLLLTLLVGFGAVYALNALLIGATGIEDRLRGSLDYRDLQFLDDGDSTLSASAYWQEDAQTRVRWSPYSDWLLDAFDGEYITVDANGLRHTPNYADGAASAADVYFFGGSTMWGEGARDAYTIPGHVARLLHEAGTPQNVVNYGQTGYVSTQDMLLFQMQLLRGNVPDVAVFYQGFNDILAAYAQGASGLTLQEAMRARDSEAGRLLRAGQALFSLPPAPDYDYTLAAAGAATPEGIVARWWANVEMMRVLADAYGVEVLFVWQPAIIHKSTLTESEQGIYARMERERPGLGTLYAAVDALVRQRIAGDTNSVLYLARLFAGDERAIFHDLVHITEYGNQSVAEAILPELQARLR